MSLFSAIAKALVKNIGNFASGLVGVPIAGAIVVDAWENWQRDTDERNRKAEIEVLARKAIRDILPEALQAVQREAGGLAEAQRKEIIIYLGQLPASIRRSLRRPQDPGGTTLRADLSFRKPDDLLRMLPAKLPRFKPGDRPLSNSDLELIELVGQGGFGEVWKARHLDRPHMAPVALKFCLDAGAIRSLERERDLLDQVARAGQHDGIVQLRYTHLRTHPPCLEYEFIEGGDLTSVFVRNHAKGPPTPHRVAQVVYVLAKILAFAHAQQPAIVHRDLKPANILVRRRGDSLQFKIADFGIGGLAAKQALDALKTGQTNPSQLRLDTLIGAYTPLYASPEQVKGEPPDPRDDVYALGIIWYQLQTGLHPIVNLPSDWREDLVEAKTPAPFIDLLAACIGRLARRPHHAGELVATLKPLLKVDLNAPTRDQPTSAVQPAPPPVVGGVLKPPRMPELPQITWKEQKAVMDRLAVALFGGRKWDFRRRGSEERYWVIDGEGTAPQIDPSQVVEALIRKGNELGLTRGPGDGSGDYFVGLCDLPAQWIGEPRAGGGRRAFCLAF